MYQVTAKIDNVPIKFVHSAADLPLGNTEKHWQKYKQVKEHIKKHPGASHLCVTKSEDTESWRLAPAGGSCLAACIEDWLSNSADELKTAQKLVVLIPFDAQIYTAECTESFVLSEKPLARQRLANELKTLDSGTIFQIFDTGAKTQEEIAHLGTPITPPFKFNKFVYQPIWLVFLKHLMPHPFHAAPFAAPPLLYLAAVLYAPAGQIAEEIEELVQTQPKTLTVQASAFNRLDALGDLFVMPAVITYMFYGLSSIELNGLSVVLEGVSKRYPAKVADLAKKAGANFSIADGAWTIQMALPAQNIRQNAKTFDDLALTQTMYAAAEIAEATFTIEKNFTGNGIKSATYNFQIISPRQIHLKKLAGAFKNQPVELTKASCQYQARRWQTCTFTIEASGSLPI